MSTPRSPTIGVARARGHGAEEVREEVELVLARAVQLAAVHGHEVRVEGEVPHDALGVDRGFEVAT